MNNNAIECANVMINNGVDIHGIFRFADIAEVYPRYARWLELVEGSSIPMDKQFILTKIDIYFIRNLCSITSMIEFNVLVELRNRNIERTFMSVIRNNFSICENKLTEATQEFKIFIKNKLKRERAAILQLIN